MNAYRPTRCSTFLILGVLCCAVSAGDERAKEAQSGLSLRVEDKPYPVFFQDSTLTDAERRAIVADYQVLLQVGRKGDILLYLLVDCSYSVLVTVFIVGSAIRDCPY